MSGVLSLVGGGSWTDNLQPASWRGISFAVMDSEVRRGRRVAIHEYPYRDIVWVEDLGRATRRYGFRGFYVGDDCYDIEQQMLDAAEVKGDGALVHPSLGSLTVSLVEFSVGQRRELGRVVEFQFGFIEGGAGDTFPSWDNATQSSVASAADEADTASKGDFFDRAWSSIKTAGASVKQAVATVKSYVKVGLSVVHDASRLVNSVTGLAGLISGRNISLGRFSSNLLSRSGGPLGSFGSVLSGVQSITSTVGRVEAGAIGAVNNAVRLGTSVKTAADKLTSLAGEL